jgi:AcrR family transcriptional regulator
MPRKKSLLDRRERILLSADSLFNHYGLEKTTMEDISRESGIPRATIYTEFPGGKEDILMASLERYLEQVIGSMRELVRQSRSGRLETLKQVILFNILANYDHATEFQYSPHNLQHYSSRVRQEMNSYFQARIALFEELLQQAALGGEISAEYNHSRLAAIISHALVPFMPPLATRLPRKQIETDANALFSLLLSGIAKSNQRLVQV